MTSRDIVFAVCAAVLVAVLVYKLRHLRARWGDPRLWALCTVLFLLVVIMWFSAPASQSWAGRVTGIPNFAVLLNLCFSSAVAAAYLTLALLWRYPTERAWPPIRWILTAYALTLAAMVVLFGLSSVPEERPFDFPVYYATQPTVAAFVGIWLVSLLVGGTILAYWCFSWARAEDSNLPWLRCGLRLYGTVPLIGNAYALLQLAAVCANWFGVHALNPLARWLTLPAGIAVGALLAAALVVPVWGPRWPAVRLWARRWRVLPALWSLHRALRPVAPEVVFVAPGKRLNPHHRVRRMMMELSDWRWMLAPLFDPAVAAAAQRAGRQAGLTEHQISTVIEAAQLKAAARAWGDGARASDTAAERHSSCEEAPRDGAGVDELTWWLHLARAFRSPMVETALAEQRTTRQSRGNRALPEL
ncbi:MAB_1171c family putative transporter [Allosalinactinospora lopnorensis]|uniref:MAB_1171c family putative transporter n=1 Tax=Allosalinactinospora lopnorensis TaxID=1352348 RepID=UPI000623FD73|nr:MAB_1171c family putative transporter [Allosalinactinospora lopnorensis]